MIKMRSVYGFLCFFSFCMLNFHAFGEKMELICNMDDFRGTDNNWNTSKYVGKQENFVFDDNDLTVSFSNFGKIFVEKFQVLSHSNQYVSSGRDEKGLYWEHVIKIPSGTFLYRYFLFVSRGVLEITVKTPGHEKGPIIGNCGSKTIGGVSNGDAPSDTTKENQNPDLLAQWQSRNVWFGRDRVLTEFALGVHKDLERSEGVDVGSDFYYRQIDIAMRQNFPDQFKLFDDKAFSEIEKLVSAGQITEALSILTPIALAGNDKAQAALGYHFATGWGVSQDFKIAFDLYSSAAAKGNVHAMFSVGVAYQNGEGVTKDPNRAASWYELAIRYGDEFIKSRASQALEQLGTVQSNIAQGGDSGITIKILDKSIQDTIGSIRGSIDGYDGTETLTIDKAPVELTSSGDFFWSGYIPGNGKDVVLKLIDSTGKTFFEVAEFKRTSLSSSGISFSSLQPTRNGTVASDEHSIAIVIGIEKYKHTQANATFANNDASVFSDYAHEKLGVPRNRIKLITNDEADTRGILLSIQRWLTRQIKPGESNVFVFFAGHGMSSDDGEKMFLVPHDGEIDLLEKTAISRDEIFRAISGAQPQSVNVFFDTCYSGFDRNNAALINARPIVIEAKKQSIPDNFTVMTAAAGDQTAKPLEEAKHGMFSYFLMKGMEGEADANNDNEITAGELHSYVQTNVIQQSSGSQTPELQGDADRVLVRFQ